MDYSTVKDIDTLGRVVIPADIRKAMHLGDGTKVRLTWDNGRIVMRPEIPVCRVCFREGELDEKFGICKECMKKIKLEP